MAPNSYDEKLIPTIIRKALKNELIPFTQWKKH